MNDVDVRTDSVVGVGGRSVVPDGYTGATSGGLISAILFDTKN